MRMAIEYEYLCMFYTLTLASAAAHSAVRCMPLLCVVYMLITFGILVNVNVTLANIGLRITIMAGCDWVYERILFIT